MKNKVLEMKLTNDIGSINCLSAKAMDEIMTVMMDIVVKNLEDESTGLLNIPPQALIVMMTNNIFMNLFLRFYSGDMATLIEDAGGLCDDLKKILIDCLQKVFVYKAETGQAH